MGINGLKSILVHSQTVLFLTSVLRIGYHGFIYPFVTSLMVVINVEMNLLNSNNFRFCILMHCVSHERRMLLLLVFELPKMKIYFLRINQTVFLN